jgi:hypothetical protein
MSTGVRAGKAKEIGWVGLGIAGLLEKIDNGEVELAHFLQLVQVDIPAEPLPEDTPMFRQRPFSY